MAAPKKRQLSCAATYMVGSDPGSCYGCSDYFNDKAAEGNRNASATACRKADTRAVGEAQRAVGASLRCVLLV